jgi:hypothetical protein
MSDSTATLNSVLNYLSSRSGATYSDGDVQQALAAERDVQRRSCRSESDWPVESALLEALCRRVHRNLAMRGLPLGVQATEVGGIRPALEDAEVRRLERPYRKTVVG